MASAFRNQIDNRNFLSPIGFKFSLVKYPKVSFFCNSSRIPEINLGLANQPSYLKNLDIPGDIITYGDLTLRFLVDENLENYMAIHNWITGLGFPETPQQFKDQTTNADGIRNLNEQFSDGNLSVLNSNYKPVANVKFKDLFPIALSSLEFDASSTDVQYFTAEATFKYTVYNILDTNNEPL